VSIACIQIPFYRQFRKWMQHLTVLR
jgi:hypothetical protein